MTLSRVESVLHADGTVAVFIDGRPVLTVDSDDELRALGQLLVTMADKRQGRTR